MKAEPGEHRSSIDFIPETYWTGGEVQREPPREAGTADCQAAIQPHATLRHINRNFLIPSTNTRI